MKILSSNLILAFCCATIVNIGYFGECEPLANGDNVCNETITIKREKLVEQPVKYEIKHQAICGFLPCTKVRTEIRMDSKIKTTFEEVEKATCCPGYAETPDRKCAPICLKSCQNGKCIAPEICKCNTEPTETSPGFVGSTCNRFVCLSDNRWGSKCDRECNCPTTTSYCSASSGKCLCRNGWRGVNCTEECDPNMNCDDVELPPILEPEVNVIDDNLIVGSSQKLISSSQARSILGETDTEFDHNQSSKSIVSLVAAHMGVNLFLLLLTCILILTLFWYKKRLNQIRNQLYYGPYSTSSCPSSGGSDNISNNYSTTTVSSRMGNRPRMPTPLEDDFLGKNLNFASATRNILSKDSNSALLMTNKQMEGREKYILDPKIECHLISSQMNSKQNIYSDIDSSFGDKSYVIEQSKLQNVDESRMLNKSLNLIPEEHEYQVPKSANIKAVTITLPPETSNINDPLIRVNNIYEEGGEINRSEGESYYEEIKPKSS